MKRSGFNLFIAGLDPNDADALRRLCQELDPRLTHRWRVTPALDDADLVIFAPQAEAGRQALLSRIAKKQALFVPFYASEDAESGSNSVHKLAAPLRESSLMLLLDRVGRDRVTLAPQHSREDASGSDDYLTQPFGRTLLEELQDTLAKRSGGGLRIDLTGNAAVIVDSAKHKVAAIGTLPPLRLWHLTHPLSTKELSADGILKLEESGVQFGSATRYLWSIGMASDTALLPSVKRGGLLRLKRYPNLPALDHESQHRAICTALLTRAHTFSDLVETYGERYALQACNACALIGLLQVSRFEGTRESANTDTAGAVRAAAPASLDLSSASNTGQGSPVRPADKPKRSHLYSLIRSRLGLRQ